MNQRKPSTPRHSGHEKMIDQKKKEGDQGAKQIEKKRGWESDHRVKGVEAFLTKGGWG